MSDIRNLERTVLPAEMYYSGTCGSNETNEQIATQFLEIFQETGFSPTYCSVDDACTVQNIRVTCDPATRRRRDVFASTKNGRGGRVKRAENDRYVDSFCGRNNERKLRREMKEP